MKSEKLYDAITDVREDLVTEARPAQKRPARKRWLSLTAAGLAAMLAVSLLLPSEKTGSPLVPSAGAVLLSEAEYPEMAPYPDESAYFKADGTFDDDAFYDAFKVWYGNFQDRWVYRERNRGLLDHFFTESLSDFLYVGVNCSHFSLKAVTPHLNENFFSVKNNAFVLHKQLKNCKGFALKLDFVSVKESLLF